MRCGDGRHITPDLSRGQRLCEPFQDEKPLTKFRSGNGSLH